MNLPNWLPRRIPRPWRWVQTLDFGTLSPEDNRWYWGLVYTCAYRDRRFLVAMPFCLPARWIYWLWCWMRVKRNRWEKALSAEYHRGRLAEHNRMQKKITRVENARRQRANEAIKDLYGHFRPGKRELPRTGHHTANPAKE